MATTPKPRCSVCDEPLIPGDQVIYGQAELIHVRCHFGWSSVGQRIAAVLRLHHDRQFCHTCLAASLEIPFEEARKAIAGLRAMRQLAVIVGSACSHCRAPRVTLRAGGDGGADSPPRSLTSIVRAKLEAGFLPRRLTELTPEATAIRPRLIGRGTGKLCSACDTMIDPLDRGSQELVSGSGRVTRFHRLCYEVWNEERRRSASQPRHGEPHGTPG